MALSKATLIDLNSNELVLDLDADTSITADTDDTIHFKIAGSDEITMTATAFAPSTSDGQALGTSSLMFSDLFLASASVINFNNGDVTLTHGSNLLTLDGGALDLDGEQLILDADGDTKLVESSDDVIHLQFAGSTSTPTEFGAGYINLKNQGTQSYIRYYCESSNAHYTQLQAAAHSDYSGNATVTLPVATSTLATTSLSETLTNKTLTTPIIAEIDSGSTITLDATTDIILDADGGDVFFKDGGTTIATFTNSSSDFIVESGVSDKDIIFKVNDGGSSTEVARFDGDVSSFKMASGKKIMLGAAEETISGDGTDITFEVGSSGDINIPANIGLTFGDDGEKIEGDGTDLTISGNNINLTATADVVVPANVGVTFGSGEKIEGDDTDLTITSGAKINLTATSDVHIPNNVGIVFGGDSEKIEGDGTDLTISANNLTVDAAADINLDADGADVNIKDGGTTILSFTNSSSDAVITAGVQDKDIIFKGDDGGSAVTSLTLDMSAGGIATFSAAANVAQGALTSSSNAVAWDASAKPNAVHVTTENTTFSAPSNAVEGAFICIEINYNGSHSIAWNTVFEFAASTEATETATDGKTDILVFRYNGAVWQEVGRTLNLAES